VWDLPTRVFHWSLAGSVVFSYVTGKIGGGWMVILLLALLLLQAVTGLFSNDEVATEGPLAVKVSNAIVDRMSVIHEYNQWVIVIATALHVAAVGAYQWGLKVDLIHPMIFGPAPRPASLALALALLSASAAAVYALVVIYPRV
jgi:cytochrome b